MFIGGRSSGRPGRPLRVLVIGPKFASGNSRGGMATVVSLMREHRDDRVRITTVATYVDDSRGMRLAVGVAGMIASSSRVLARRTDVVHVHLAHGGSVVRKALPLLAARLVGLPSVVHAHSFDFAGWFDALGPTGRRIVRALLPADQWLVLGDELAEQYRSRMWLRPDQVSVLSNPVVIPSRSPRSRTGSVGVLSLGRLGERKGSYDLVSAVAAAREVTRAGMTVVAAGDGEVEQVSRAASDAGVAGTMSVRSWVEPAERDELLAASEIFVLASYAEGLPMALLEAMSWGLVPIVTPVGGIPQAVQDGVHGMFVAPGDVAGLTAALDSLVADRPRRQAMGEAAQARARDFAADTWFETLIELWTQLAGSRR